MGDALEGPGEGEELTRRQVEILDRAVEVLREQGLPGLTVRRLAERMGFSEAALYRHFSSKDDLLAALIGRLAGERLLGPVRAIAADEGRTPRQRLQALVDHQLSTLVDLEGVPLLFLAEALASGDERLLARARWVTGSLMEIASGLIRQLPADPRRPPPEALALTLFGLAAATAMRFRLAADPSEHPEPEAVRRLARFVLQRLLGDDPADGADPAID